MDGARLVDGQVRRPVGPRSHFVHMLLRHLEVSGLTLAPRVLGVDGDEEVLSYVDGHVPVEVDPDGIQPIVFSDKGVSSAFRLIRRFHDAVAGCELAGREEVVCHGDLSPWNTVYSESGARAFIDWDSAAPGSRGQDLGYATWRFLMPGFASAPPVETQRRWLAIVATEYGMWSPAELLDLVAEAQDRQQEHFHRMQIAGDPRYLRLIDLGALGYIADARAWLTSHRTSLC